MKLSFSIHYCLAAVCLFAAARISFAAQPLRVFIRAGVKTHGPGQHDHPRFLGEWTQLLGERGMKVDGAMEFPDATQLEKTDVVVIFAADGMKIVGDDRVAFEKYLSRGGGLVVIHDGVVSGDQHAWAKKVQGGAWVWENRRAKWYEGEVGLYVVDPTHPITQGLSNFDWKDEIYHDLDMAPEAKVLATSFHSVFVIAPQLWTYEKTWEGGSAPYRAFVSLPGHEYASFQTPHYRAVLLRGIAWAGKRTNADEFCKPEELASLRYPEGGPTAPEKAAAKLAVHPEFNINLVAAEPLVEKVISLDWAPDGKLWVAETPEYPGGRTINRNDKMVALWNVANPEAVAAGDKEQRPARDRISWLEDCNGDGLMDKKHVFHEGLELVTSLVFYKDGVIVSQAPEILWIRDTNGDGKSDKVETLYTGFGTFDTHAVINNFRWGLDGWIYSSVGYSAGQPKSGDGSKDFGRITAGILRFKPDGSALEQYASGSCNTWGFDFAADGEAFYTTATCGEHLLHIVMPEKALARGNAGGVRASWVAPDHQKIAPAVKHTRPAYMQIDWVGMFTASAGSCIYDGGAWPERFNGSHFSSETTMSLVHHDFFRPSGASYTAFKEAGREDTEFIAGSDLWFRPVHARVGPDGALYVVDFYNQAAIHNDTRGPAHGARNAATRPDRDHFFTRIWRVQHKQAKPLKLPALAAKNPAEWVRGLESENGWARGTAARLLRENGVQGQADALAKLAANSQAKNYARAAALHTLQAAGQLQSALLAGSVSDTDSTVRKNALRIASERPAAGAEAEGIRTAALGRLNDSDPRVQLNAFLALANLEPSAEIARAVVASWPSLKDKHLQSAAIGVASRDPLAFVDASLRAQDPAFLADFVPHAVRLLALKNDAALAASLVEQLAAAPMAADALKQAALEALAQGLGAKTLPAWTPALQAAFARLLESSRAGIGGAVLPLAARWDTAGAMKPRLQPALAALRTRLSDASLPDDQRGQVAVNLIGVRNLDAGILPATAALLGSNASQVLQQRVVEALGAIADASAGELLLAAYTRVPVALQEPVFGALVRRSEWCLKLIQALEDKKLDVMAIGPANLHRLRTHSDAKVASRAVAVIDAIRGPEQKQKEALIAQFREAVQRPAGNLEAGRQSFTANCAGCHVYKNEGRDLAPNLTGMGAHGPEDLLVHIIDPNRVVEPNFVSVSIETQDDLSYDGMVQRENSAEVLLRNATGDYTVRKDAIRSRKATGRSLMPEGFEALGADGLHNLIAYLCSDESRFRILDLTAVFSANAGRGIFHSEDARDETIRFKKYGTAKVGDVPFDVVSSAKSPTGRNLLVLKGGNGLSKSYPAKVEVKAGFTAQRLHFLGGVGGWAWPYDGERHKNLPVAKVTLRYKDGNSEEMVLRNGVEFADYVSSRDVPGSVEVADWVHNGRQIRTFAKDVKGRGVIDAIGIESFDNVVAPVFAAITAELEDGAGKGGASQSSATAAATMALKFTPRQPGPSGIRALLVGGGASHDYTRWFHLADKAILSELKPASLGYTEEVPVLGSALANLDVLCLSINKAIPDPAVRHGVFQFAEAGRGIMLLHAGLWYNWADWVDYNRVLCGGGSRGHDRLGEFEVTVTEPSHPLMRGVPAKFKIVDELYYFEPDAAGTPIKVLATAHSAQKNKTYPMVFVVQHPKARIAANTLGHDGQAHSHEAYKTLLKNAMLWTAGEMW